MNLNNKNLEKDCPEPICFKTDLKGAYKLKEKTHINFEKEFDNSENKQQQENIKKQKENTNNNNISSLNNDQLNQNNVDYYRQCPNSRESLGFYTWNFLHTMAIYYPENPSEEQKTLMIYFFQSFAEFFPCKICSSHFKKEIVRNPPQVNSNQELSIWLCEQHNKVNLWLNKQQFDCSYENLKLRWKTGYSNCQD